MPAPTVHRRDDGTCWVDWGTPDGEMPAGPVQMTPQLIAEVVKVINEAAAVRDLSRYQVTAWAEYVPEEGGGVDVELRLVCRACGGQLLHTWRWPTPDLAEVNREATTHDHAVHHRREREVVDQ